MNKSLEFRRMLAEAGIETTPEQATELKKMSDKIIKTAKKISMKEIWSIESAAGLSGDDLEQIKNLYLCAKEL